MAAPLSDSCDDGVTVPEGRSPLPHHLPLAPAIFAVGGFSHIHSCPGVTEKKILFTTFYTFTFRVLIIMVCLVPRQGAPFFFAEQWGAILGLLLFNWSCLTVMYLSPGHSSPRTPVASLLRNAHSGLQRVSALVRACGFSHKLMCWRLVPSVLGW